MIGTDISQVAIFPTQQVMDDITRAREFYKYLQPANLLQPHLRRRESTFDVEHEHVPSLSAALAPYCQLTALRCNVAKAMLNVMDRDVMYFLAESSREKTTEHGQETYEFVEDPIFLSCSSVPLKGRVCEMVVRMERNEVSPAISTFVIRDLTKSSFAHLPVIAGPPYYKFYAGVPIVTRDDVCIGSLAIMDTEVRPDGLTRKEEEFLAQTSRQVMVYLETNRQAIEGRRSKKIAKGLEAFLAGCRSMSDQVESASDGKNKRRRGVYGLPSHTNVDDQSFGALPARSSSKYDSRKNSIASIDSELSTSELSTDGDEQKIRARQEGETRSHAQTFARAANLLRECMDGLGDDGVVSFQSLRPRFGGASSKTTESVMNELQQYPNERETTGITKPRVPNKDMAQIIACSTSTQPFESGDALPLSTLSALREQDLREILERYPNGRLWLVEDASVSSSEEDNGASLRSSQRTASSRQRKPSRRARSELKLIRAAFPQARQVLFAPCWDATIGAPAHGVFIATTLETRSFDTASELSFLNSFCSTVMAECSRLDTMLADKQKSDFVGTISHEMRSPLHGVLASTEFLSDTETTEFQKSLIATIDSCGRTLLDTINHVLDFSKVNSFQKQWQSANKRLAHRAHRNPYLDADNSSRSITHGAPPLLQLFGVTNISAVLEEVVDGLVLGHTFHSGIDLTDMSKEARGRGGTSSTSPASGLASDPVNMILDVEEADWDFMTQPGAVRRIIMNITGNAIKYTSQGSIHISLRLKELHEPEGATVVFSVTDTGEGISTEFLATRLFVPFAQENALAPGTGLGLSIVRSIVLMLGGTIDVRSTVGMGTTVQVTLPLKRPLPGQTSTQSTPHSGNTIASSSSSGDNSITLLRHQASDATVAFHRADRTLHERQAEVLEQYVRQWYHLNFVDQILVESTSVVIVEEADLEHLMGKAFGTPERHPALVVLCSVATRHNASLIKALEARLSSPVEFLAKPCGPYKLARSIRLVLEKAKAIRPRFVQVTNLGSIPEAITPQLPTSVDTASGTSTSGMPEMNLNRPGETNSAKVVQATETFAASQNSQRAQMAITDPTPNSSTSADIAGGRAAFPFPPQGDNTRQNHHEHENGTVSINEPSASLTLSRSNPALAPNAKSQGDVRVTRLPEINPRLLLVDDNKINLKLLETFLTNKRHYSHIAKAEDGQQAVDHVKNSNEQFDIIFMDISMPVLNGFEATRAIRKHEETYNVSPGAMIIALTGLASGRDQSEGFDAGCDIYMTKPVSFKEVGKLLDNWEEHQRLDLARALADTHLAEKD